MPSHQAPQPEENGMWKNTEADTGMKKECKPLGVKKF